MRLDDIGMSAHGLTSVDEDSWDRTDSDISSLADSPTTVYEDEPNDDDMATMVYQEEAPKPACTVIRMSNNEEFTIETSAILGRGSAADVRITGNSYIGRAHAKITSEEGAFFIEDLGSANHTRVNGEQLDERVPTPLYDGDVVELAKEEFAVSIG